MQIPHDRLYSDPCGEVPHIDKQIVDIDLTTKFNTIWENETTYQIMRYHFLHPNTHMDTIARLGGDRS